ncbi:MAG: guanine deaminase [Aestuariibacter sp.]
MQKLIKGKILHFARATATPENDYTFIADGALLVESGKIAAIGTAPELQQQFPNALQVDYSEHYILPGFIDSHIHMPQTEMIASYGEQLLDWLNKYTFPTERQFENAEYADRISRFFLKQLWQNGTTSAMAYATVHPTSVNALFNAASEHDMAIWTGKVCMDRHSPEWLQDTAQTAYSESAELIEKWHHQGRNRYVITPRFAPTSTPEQLAAIGKLQKEYPDTYLQTHLSENTDEVEWVKSLFPEAKNYLDVYDQYGLVHDRAFFGHCIYLDDDSWQTLADRKAKVSFCPRSNTFLGSGLYPLHKAKQYGVVSTLATDVAGGDSFNMLRTLGEAYKVCQLQGETLDAMSGLYMMTMGSAIALGADKEIGNLSPQSAADFVVLDPHFSDLSQLRITDTNAPEDVIFALSMLADERTTVATWIAGNPVFEQEKR